MKHTHSRTATLRTAALLPQSTLGLARTHRGIASNNPRQHIYTFLVYGRLETETQRSATISLHRAQYPTHRQHRHYRIYYKLRLKSTGCPQNTHKRFIISETVAGLVWQWCRLQNLRTSNLQTTLQLSGCSGSTRRKLTVKLFAYARVHVKTHACTRPHHDMICMKDIHTHTPTRENGKAATKWLLFGLCKNRWRRRHPCRLRCVKLHSY